MLTAESRSVASEQEGSGCLRSPRAVWRSLPASSQKSKDAGGRGECELVTLKLRVSGSSGEFSFACLVPAGGRGVSHLGVHPRLRRQLELALG